MLRALFVFIVLLASVWLGIQLNQDPGYILIALNQWTIETTLWIAVIGLIAAFCILHFLLSFVSGLIRFPSLFRQWRHQRRAHKARLKTRQGLIEFSEGDWSKAKKHLIKALPESDAPLLNYLTAARAAQELGDYQLRDDYLRDAQQAMPEAKIAVELTQAQLQLANQQWEQALATLKHLQNLMPNHPYVLKLLMKLYKQVRDWPQLIKLLPELKRHHVVSTDAYKRLEQLAYIQLMRDHMRHNQSQALSILYEDMPRRIVNNPEIVRVYCQFLIQREEKKQAEILLRRSLNKRFDDELIGLYGQLGQDAKLSFVESLQKQQPVSAALFLCLGQLSVQHNLWGKAKTYLERSIELKATPQAYGELGHLLQEHFQDQLGACHAYRQGLMLQLTHERG